MRNGERKSGQRTLRMESRRTQESSMPVEVLAVVLIVKTKHLFHLTQWSSTSRLFEKRKRVRINRLKTSVTHLCHKTNKTDRSVKSSKLPPSRRRHLTKRTELIKGTLERSSTVRVTLNLYFFFFIMKVILTHCQPASDRFSSDTDFFSLDPKHLINCHHSEEYEKLIKSWQ